MTAAIVVSTPQSVATLDADKAIKMFHKTNINVLGVIENMSTHICSNCNHIKLFPINISIGSIPKFIHFAITFNGSPASEYTCFGIPVITPCESECTGLGYTIDTHSKEEYFFQLQNAIKLKKLNNQQIELAKIYLFIFYKLTAIPVNLIAPMESSIIDEKRFWTLMTKLLNEYNFGEDLLLKMMKIQEANNDMHTIDYRVLEKRN